MLAGTDLDKVIVRHRAFWQRGEVRRPLIGVRVGTYFPLQEFPGVLQPGLVTPEMLEPEGFLARNEELFAERSQVDEDLFWTAMPLSAIPWMEAIIGCPIRASTESCWSMPILDSLDDIENIALGPENGWFRKLLEFTRLLAQQSVEDSTRRAGRYPVVTTLMRGPSDMMSALRGASNLCVELYDRPDKVARLAEICTAIWIEVGKAQLGIIPPFHDGYCNSMGLWAPGLSLMTQEDASIFFSPSMYRRFLWHWDRKIAEGFDYTVIHLHSAALHTVDDLCQIPALAAIQVVLDVGGPPVRELIPAFARIQREKPLVICGDLSWPDMELICGELSPCGLALYAGAETVERAREIGRWVDELWPTRR